jgi:2-polyprenyl-6-methoxyphenol hydroxylase-like FAD-dependent oxidoreductase
VTERAKVVVGADGRRSVVAKAARPHQYNERPPLASVYYAYWSGVPAKGFEVYIRDRRAFAAWPTHDDLTLVVAGWPEDEFKANRGDVEGNFLLTLELDPAFAERIRAGTRETRFAGAGDLRGYFRTPYGAGWELVGDAGHHKHPITAMGMTDAFIDAERLAGALDDWLTGRRSFDDAMGDYHRIRDEQALLAAVARDQDAQRDFVSVQAGTVAVPAFFDPDNIERILANAN